MLSNNYVNHNDHLSIPVSVTHGDMDSMYIVYQKWTLSQKLRI